MATEAEVVNAVSVMLAEEQVSGLADTPKIAEKVRMRWNVDRDAALRAHPWNFATELFQTAAMSVPPAFGYSYRYQLSANPYVLRVVKVEGQSKFNTWRVVGRTIHTNLTAPLRYEATWRVTDATQWDALFVDFFSTIVAANVAFDITGQTTIQEKILRIAEGKRRLAQSVDGQEDERDNVDRSGSLLAGLYDGSPSGGGYNGRWEFGE